MNELSSYVKDIKAKKNFGQNFLVRPDILDKIITAANIESNTSVIEIGPGPGSLTRWLIKTPAKSIYAIEKDTSMKKHLDQLSCPHLTLEFSDALNLDFWKLGDTPRVLVSNLPYNVATPLLVRTLLNAFCFKCIVLMFQKEVALRIIAKPGSKAYGRLSILTQLFAKVSLVTDVSPCAFKPQPKVYSSVLQIIPYKQPLYPVNINTLQKLLHHVFQKRRKMLRSSLKDLVKDPFFVLKNSNINPTQRPENLSLENFCTLSNSIDKYN